MTCKGCHSEKQNVFNGEIAIHFHGFEGLDKSIVWIFPKLVVCLHSASRNSPSLKENCKSLRTVLLLRERSF
jgi:hypothetical protein